MAALLQALAPLKGYLHELQLQRTTVGPKALQALTTSLVDTFGTELEVCDHARPCPYYSCL